MWHVILVNCLLFAAVDNVHSKTQGSTLKFVFVTTRGGEHEPCNYPGGPRFSKISKNESESNLIEAGINTAYELGQNLSERYKSKLGIESEWDKKSYWSFAGKAKRNQEAALVLGGGLNNKEETKKKQWSEDELKKTEFNLIDYYFKFLNPADCPEYYKEFMTKTAETVKELSEKYNNSIKKIKDNYEEVNTTNPVHLWITYETVQRLKSNGTKPEWWDDTVEKDLKEFSEKFLYAALTESDKLRKLSGGPMLADILSDMDKIKSGQKQPQSNLTKGLSIFSTSQSLVAAQLAAFSPKGTKLNNKEFQADTFYPQIGATHVIELHKDENEWKVKMLYKNGNNDYETMKLEGCEDMCSYETFNSKLQSLKLTQEAQKTECGGKKL